MMVKDIVCRVWLDGKLNLFSGVIYVWICRLVV